MIFNRLWKSRLFLAVCSFLWPGSFVLTTQQFALSVSSPYWETEQNCYRFILLVYAILEPAFCVLLVLHVQFDCNICSKLQCLSQCSSKSTKREDSSGAITACCICYCTLLLLLPSIAYHLVWIFLAFSSPWSTTNQQPTIGPCAVPLENLLGVSIYGTVSLIFLNIFARR